MINIEKINEIKDKLVQKKIAPTTEEATKQWLIMPVLLSLGYDPYSSDIIPEYTLDVGVKKGERVDYAIQINNQPVMIIECKQLNVQLSDKQISQLYRYFTISNVHIAVLTNGDDYWFFTDSQKQNIMDLEPYYKIKISEAENSEIEKLEQYSKDKIQYINVAQTVQYERYINNCKEFAHSLRINNIPSWIIETLAEKSSITDIDKPTLAKYLQNEIQNEFNGYKIDKKQKIDEKHKLKEKYEQGKKNRSNIKLNHEYVYNDYTDGDWTYHTIDYAIILETKYEDSMNARKLLISTIIELLKQGKIDRDNIIKEQRFKGMYKIDSFGGYRGAYYISEYNMYISTSFSIGGIVQFIHKLLEYASIQDDEIRISFKD